MTKCYTTFHCRSSTFFFLLALISLKIVMLMTVTAYSNQLLGFPIERKIKIILMAIRIRLGVRIRIRIKIKLK